jgi:predicted RNA-binding Zn-ribbon protein involved in translation (DUF1610 family)
MIDRGETTGVTEAARYKQAWGDRRARIFMVWLMILGFAVSLLVWPNPWLAAGCFAGALIGAYGYYQFRCPRCGERFLPLPRDARERSWGERCQHCELEKNALYEEPEK